MLVRRVIASVRGITKFPERKINIEKFYALTVFYIVNMPLSDISNKILWATVQKTRALQKPSSRL